MQEVALAVGDVGTSNPIPVGLISDTHGVLDSATLHALTAAAPHSVIHAGDVGDKGKKLRLPAADIIEKLQEYAVNKTVVAVAGNVDESVSNLPSFQVVVVAGIRILVVHICGFPPNISEETQQLIDATSPQIVVFGHSHMPGVQWHNNILFVNPGSAGPRRFKLPRCMALLHLHLSGVAEVRFMPVGTSPQDVQGLPQPMTQCLSSRA